MDLHIYIRWGECIQRARGNPSTAFASLYTRAVQCTLYEYTFITLKVCIGPVELMSVARSLRFSLCTKHIYYNIQTCATYVARRSLCIIIITLLYAYTYIHIYIYICSRLFRYSYTIYKSAVVASLPHNQRERPLIDLWQFLCET